MPLVTYLNRAVYDDLEVASIALLYISYNTIYLLSLQPVRFLRGVLNID